MGFDRFANFIFKSINSDCIEEVNINNNMKPLICNNIMFDVNFLIYQEIINIENEINDIIKILLCIESNNNENINNIILDCINNILKQKHWEMYYNQIELILKNKNSNDIINKFLFLITNKISTDSCINISLIEYIIYEKILVVMKDYIEKFHFTKKFNFVNNIIIFFDGIPSFSKIIEQRRRRTKNFLEMNEKKIKFKYYFDNMIPNFTKLSESINNVYLEDNKIFDELYFDYFKWLKNRFSIDKSFGPSSEFIINFENYLKSRFNTFFDKTNIIINNAEQNGESDIKIFKYISELEDITGDFCIHTTDSDLIHHILVQQVYYNLINKDVNLTVVKYLKNYNNIGYAQILDSQLIINNITSYYSNLTNKPKNIKLIWDLCFIFYLFGNDNLPSSLEVGPELGLEYFLNYVADNSDNNIINLVNGNIDINLKNLLIILKKINNDKTKNITRIILQRYFKINLQLINLFVDEFNFNFNEIINALKYFIYYQRTKLSDIELDDLDEDDLRKQIVSDNNDNIKISDNNDKISDNNDKKISDNNDKKISDNDNIKKKLIDNESLILDNINFSNNDYMGLILYNKPINISNNDAYQDLYSFIIDITNSEQICKIPYLYDHIDLEHHLKLLDKTTDNEMCNDYLKKIYHLCKTTFGNMKDHFSNNLTYYKYNYIPTIEQLIIFLENNNIKNITDTWDKDIINDNTNNYINSVNHHIIITPFLLELNESLIHYSNDIIKSLILNSSHISNLWLDINNIDKFDYRNIDIRKYLLLWNKCKICKIET
jgi:hypothetical protein